MNTEMTEKNETSRSKISITVLWKALKKFWIVVLIAAVLTSIVAGVYRRVTKDESYTVTSEFAIVNINSKNEAVDGNSQSAAADIASHFVELINGNWDDLDNLAVKVVTDNPELSKHLGEDRYAKGYIKGVSASKPNSDSQRFTISATSESKEKAHAAVIAVQQALPEAIESYYKKADSMVDVVARNTGSVPTDFTEASSEGKIRTNGRGTVKFAAAGGAAAAVVAYVICLFLFITDTKVHDESTIKQNFSAPIIGVIPEWNIPGAQVASKDKKKKRGHSSIVRDYKGKLLTAKTPFAVSEAFKTLRTNLCYSTAAEKCPVFAITSDFSGAGKSVISANVALSLAMLGKKTLLVECDLRRPELAEVFEIEKKAGLSELLSGVTKDSSEAITNVGVENLDVVLSGRIPPNPSELLGSENMQDFISQSKENYDIIIIDTPPAFEVSDVGVIVPMLSGVVMVARSNYSDIKAIRDSEELISGVNGKIVGYVVNDVDIKAGSSYHNGKYGYRRYYKYARYYSHYGAAEQNSEANEK